MQAAVMRTTALLCCASMLAAVSAQASAQAAAKSQLVLLPSTQRTYFQIGADVGPMNPHSYRPNEFVTNDFVFEGLVAWDSTSKGVDGVAGTSDDFVVGALAESWTIADVGGKMEIAFKLKSGVTFHDGEKWDGAAAVINFNHILGGPERKRAGFHDWYGLGLAIESWSAPDSSTFKVTFKHYYDAALQELTYIRPFRFASPKSLPPLDNKELSCNEWFPPGAATRKCDPGFTVSCPRKHGDFVCRGVKAPIGTGPYKVAKKVLKTEGGASRDLPATEFNTSCWNGGGTPCKYKDKAGSTCSPAPGSSTCEYVAEVHFEKFTGHRSNPSYDTIIVRAYKSQEDIKAALIDGSLDLAYGHNSLTPSAFVRLATMEDSPVTAHQSKTNLNTRLIVLNSMGALDTVAKRKFIMRLIDRAPLQQGELAEEAPAETLFDSSLPYCSISGLDPIAKLAASDTTVTKTAFTAPLRFLYLKDQFHQSVIAAKVIADLATAGIAVEPMPRDKDEYNNLMNTWLGADEEADTADDITCCCSAAACPNGTISFDLAYSETWGPSYDPASKLFDMTYEWGSGEADAVSTRNLQTMTRRAFIDKVRGLSKNKDAAARTEEYKSLLTTLHNEAVFLPITRKRNIAVVNKRVSGFKFGHTEFDIPIASLYPTPPIGTFTHEVKFEIKLPLSKEAFNLPKQTAFKHVVAETAGVAFAAVTITSIDDARRASAVKLDVSVKASSSTAANDIASKVTAEKLNAKLKAAGLPEAEMLKFPSASQIGGSGLSGGGIAGIVVGSVVGFLLLVALVFVIVKEKQGQPVFMPIPPEEQTLVSKPGGQAGFVQSVQTNPTAYPQPTGMAYP